MNYSAIEHPVRTGYRQRAAVRAAATLVILCSGAAFAQAPAAPALKRDAQAFEALTTMSEYLRTLKQFTVRADTTRDEVLESGQKVQFSSTVDYRVRLPNLVRAEVRSDLVQRQFFYDGATITLYAPKLKYYASVKAPAKTVEALQFASDKLGLTIPLADLFFWGSDKSGFDAIKGAQWIGLATVGGAACDHYAFRQDDVDWQVCIARGDRPLPLKLIVTTTAEPSQPQHVSVLKWNTKVDLSPGSFKFKAPAGAGRIEFAQPAAAGTGQ